MREGWMPNIKDLLNRKDRQPERLTSEQLAELRHIRACLDYIIPIEESGCSELQRKDFIKRTNEQFLTGPNTNKRREAVLNSIYEEITFKTDPFSEAFQMVTSRFHQAAAETDSLNEDSIFSYPTPVARLTQIIGEYLGEYPPSEQPINSN